jgi:hypothetical protein
MIESAKQGERKLEVRWMVFFGKIVNNGSKCRKRTLMDLRTRAEEGY